MTVGDQHRVIVTAACMLLAVAGCRPQDRGEPAGDAAPLSAREQPDVLSGPPRVAVDAATQQRLGIELAPVAATELKATAHGTAIMPQELHVPAGTSAESIRLITRASTVSLCLTSCDLGFRRADRSRSHERGGARSRSPSIACCFIYV